MRYLRLSHRYCCAAFPVALEHEHVHLYIRFLLQVNSLIGTLMMQVFYFQQDMDGLPDYIIPKILSFSSLYGMFKCASISKQWNLDVQKIFIKLREEAVHKRAKVCEANCYGALDCKSSFVEHPCEGRKS